MPILQDAQCVVLVADYIGVDAGGKVNAIGLGFSISGVQANGFTPPQHVAAFVEVPYRYVGQDFALSLELRNETTGTAVTMPGATGELDALRVSQMARVEAPVVQGFYLPREMFSRVQVVLAFPNGIPLAPGNFYHWRLEIDGQTRSGWKARFFVPGPPPGPVLGGPSGPADIPELPQPDRPADETTG